MKAKHFIKQALRGLGSLPHVGPHPGTGCAIAFSMMPGIAAWPHGFWAVIGGFAFGAAIFGPIYAYGSYDRAELSDRLERKREPESVE